MLSLIILTTLVNFSNVDKEELEYDRCVESIKCPHDGDPELKKLPKKEYEKVMECRIQRHIKCSVPMEDMEYEQRKKEFTRST